jgi:hypothetical protein
VKVTGSSCGTAIFVSSSNGNTTTLQPGATWTYTCKETLTNSGQKVVTVTDTATATGTDTVDGKAAPPETASATVTLSHVATTLTESASTQTQGSWTTITFTYKETNTGSDPISGVKVTGSYCGTATFVSSSNGDTKTLDPGATWTYTCSKKVSSQENGPSSVTDNATATGTDTVTGQAAPPETASVTVKLSRGCGN